MPTVAVICALLISFTNGVGLSDWIIRTSEHEDYKTASDPQAMRPLVFPCRTSHTRIFPKKHSFSYSYLFVGIPIGWRGSVGSFLSADLNSLAPKTEQSRPVSKSWFSVEAEDHLTRKTHISGLLGKLEAYLKSQGEIPEDYASTYLVTAPRFFGYSFNPVSFWYLYNHKRELKAMILEVNNTFDERRMYFLKEPGVGIPVPLSYPNEDGLNKPSTANDDTKTPTKFTTSWPKDFHVSPFNSRKGAYSLTASDPFYSHPNNNSNHPINNTITLNSSKSHPKLVARVFSTSDSIDPSTLTSWQKSKFLASWWWVGFVTSPRIVREAGILFFKRKLHVWYRPEVLRDSIGRHETGNERAIAHAFRSLLHSLVVHSDLSTPINFESGIITSSSPDLIVPDHLRQLNDSSAADPITLKITTPLFYAHLARHSNISKFLSSELSNNDDKTRTFYISKNPSAIISLFNNNNNTTPPPPTPLSLLSHPRWSLLLLLRNLTHNTRNTPPTFSLLDKHVLRPEDSCPRHTKQYRRAVLKLLASDILAFGFPEILDAVFWLVQVMLCYLHVMAVKEALVRGGGLQGGGDGMDGVGVWGLVVGCLGVHGWWVLGACL